MAPPSPTGEPAEPQALVVTHYFDADDLEGAATVRLTGKRVGSHGRQNLTDVFTQDDRIDDIEPGCGPTSVQSGCVQGY